MSPPWGELKQRIKEIVRRVIAPLAPAEQERVLVLARPIIEQLDKQIAESWRNHDLEAAQFAIDRLEITLRSAVEQLTSPQPIPTTEHR